MGPSQLSLFIASLRPHPHRGETWNAAIARGLKLGTDATRIRCLAVLIFAVWLSGCAGVWVSSRPIYPDSWPALAALDAERTCPDLSGTYLAVSDEAAPLVYPPGGHPREMFFFVTYGKPEPVPLLGRRILPWHLAGAFRSRDHDVWSALNRYASILETDAAHSDPNAAADWVRVEEMPDSVVKVRAQHHSKVLLSLVLKKEAQGLWTYKSGIYECKDGGLVVIGSFPPPPEENPTGQSLDIGAKFTFFRAADGSLVALEEAYTGVVRGNMVFNKWWRWQRIE